MCPRISTQAENATASVVVANANDQPVAFRLRTDGGRASAVTSIPAKAVQTLTWAIQ